MTRKMMCVFAHPDDESLAMGGTLAKYAAEGVEICLVAATRGQRGWGGRRDEYPGAEKLGEVREAELRCAAGVLGVKEVVFLGYMDGEVDQCVPGEVIGRIAAEIRRFQPQVVVTFGPEGAYGHPDHIAVSQFTAAAVVMAAAEGHAHQVSKLYYTVDSLELVRLVEEVMGGIHFEVDGKMREHTAWKDWMITTRVDASQYWQTAWEAIQCHVTQLVGMAALKKMTPEQHRLAWGSGNFYRVFSLVNGGRKVEVDLFEGIS
jgi:LmbE family N-acetylglucosaminyl deacetylase